MRRYTLAGSAGALLWGLCVPMSVLAHGIPIDLSSWGNFSPRTSLCQRIIGASSRICFDRVFAAEKACMEAQIAGDSCDEGKRDAAIDAAKQVARERVAEYCSPLDLSILQFRDLAEAQTDVVNACDAQSDAAMSIFYGPVTSTGGVSSLPGDLEACLHRANYEASKVLRRTTRERLRRLDAIAATNLSFGEKQAEMARAAMRVARARGRALQRIDAACGPTVFADLYSKSPEAFLDLVEARTDCLIAGGYVQGEVVCPAPMCGNGAKEVGEECDDGNSIDDDACHDNCTKTNCEFFPTSYDLIQAAIFESKGCTDALCHGSDVPTGGLDLRRDVSYDNLVDHASQGSLLKRVLPGDKDQSFLWRKLAAFTLGNIPDLEGGPMPSGGLPPLSQNELEAIRLWIYAGAPRDRVVDGVAGLLDACTLPADPNQIRPPEPPAPGAGVQLHMPPNALPAKSETEVCYASYYDFTDRVPQEFRGPEGTFRFKHRVETQDPLSHHLIINAYLGEYGPEHPSWGEWTCKGGALAGAGCDPKDPAACGSDGTCGSEPKRTVACIGFGPPDYNFPGRSVAFGGSQEPVASSRYPAGVYQELPLKGIVVWNSHAFNLTRQAAKVEAWVNFDFAEPAEQQFPVQGGILDPDGKIFVMNVPAFQRQRYCHHFTFPQGARLFEISSHMHKRGKLFQIYEPDGTLEGKLIYSSTQYNDPIQMTFAAPLALDSADPNDRTYRYCAEYDNGFTDPDEVKRRSTSPPPPPPFLDLPCPTTHCTEGNVGAACSGSGNEARDRSCDTSSGAGDGRCDACTLRGGVTTEDEMFLFLAYYYCDPAFPDTCKRTYGFLNQF